MADVCSHKDEARKGVSSTAHGVAYRRFLESSLPHENQLFHDPYAQLLAGEVGRAYVEERNDDNKQELINSMAIRTKRIDDEFSSNKLTQICIFGAGLCTRAWRMKNLLGKPVHFFEVDFPEIFAYKLAILKSVRAISEFDYHSVTTDLSEPGWPNGLIAAGFDPSKPTFFIMEGFINYLTEAEATSFFTALSTTLAPRGSRLIMTCTTPTTVAANKLLRFFPEDPVQFCGQFGWAANKELLEDLGVTFNRPLAVGGQPMALKGYSIITAELN